jgi:hypothetical protein
VPVYRQLAAAGAESGAHLGRLAAGLSDLAARLDPHTQLTIAPNSRRRPRSPRSLPCPYATPRYREASKSGFC